MEDYKKILAKNIKEKRLLRGFTQAELSEVLEIDPKYMSRLETGIASPSFAMLEKIAQTLTIKMTDLFLCEDDLSKEELIHEIQQKLFIANKKDLKFIHKMVNNLIG